MNRLVPWLVAAAVTAALPAVAAPETFTIDPTHTFPAYEVTHFGFSVQRGRFDKASGKITVDFAAKTGSAEVTIDAASVSTGMPKLEEHLKSPDFLDSARFPSIVFKGKSFAFDGENVKSVAGELTIRGVTKPVTLTANRFQCAPHPFVKKKACGGDFIATVKRSDYGMVYALPGLADDVTLRINVESIID
jgi:polyisoprenoid-binding protein YceI